MPHIQRPRLNYNELATLEQLLEAELKRSRLSNPDFVKSPLNKRLKRLRRKLDRNRLKLFYKSQPKQAVWGQNYPNIETGKTFVQDCTKVIEAPTDPEPPVQFLGALAKKAPMKIEPFGIWLEGMHILNPKHERYKCNNPEAANVWFTKSSEWLSEK